MDFAYSEKTRRLQGEMREFLDEIVIPAEEVYWAEMEAGGDPHASPPIIETLKSEARRRGLWNLFLTDSETGPGLTNLEYAPLCEMMGAVPLASEATNCAAPDTGNMEILEKFGTPEQKEMWLDPLLEGRIRSGFAMTEPDVASSDAANIMGSIRANDASYVINARKWFTSGALDPRCKVLIFMGKSDPTASPYRQQSMILVPMDTPGIDVVRSLTVFGYEDRGGHGEVVFDNVRVPLECMLGEEGDGFRIAQERLGPGRIHHCMRAIGLAEHALALMCRRAWERRPFGKTLAEQGVVGQWIADARLAIEQARLLVLKAAWLMDTVGNKGARNEISQIKVVAADLATRVVDRAIQVYGGAGVSQDIPLARMYAHARTLHLVDGPDEVHKMVVARRELRKYQEK